MAGNFLFEEVISDLVNPKASLIGPLLKLQYFAGRTKNEELMKYVLDELNGYKEESVPVYRKPYAKIYVDLQFGTERKNDFEFPLGLVKTSIRLI